MKRKPLLYFFFYTPGIALSILWIYHIVELVYSHKHVSSSNVYHPWYLFSASMSVFLFLFHLYVFLVVFLKSKHLQFFQAGPEQYELFMMMLDLTWSVLWLLQLLVQLMFTHKHRLYSTTTILTMLGLYVFQIVIALPLFFTIFRHWKRGLINTRLGLTRSRHVPPSHSIQSLLSIQHRSI